MLIEKNFSNYDNFLTESVYNIKIILKTYNEKLWLFLSAKEFL